LTALITSFAVEPAKPRPCSQEAGAEPPPRATWLNIQGLRALAAIMVVLVHLQTLATLAGWRPDALAFGNGGVDLFFVISGFIMVYTTGRRPMGPIAFMAARVRRIAPLYWSATLAIFLAASAAPRLFEGTHANLRHLVASLLFIPDSRSDGTFRPIVFVGWTLNYEMAFYLLFAAGLLFRRRLHGVIAVCLALTALAVWGQWAHPSGQVGFYTSPLILEFGAGMVLGLAWPRLNLSRTASIVLGCAAVGSFLFMLVAPTVAAGLDRAVIFGVPALVMTTAALALEKVGLSVRWPWLIALGNASYAIYLSHFVVTQAVIMLVLKSGLHGPATALLAAGVALAAVAAVGLVVHYGFEAPIDRRLGRAMRADRARPLGRASVLGA
jgi:exopolysaccharide production protein ExoZ